MYDAVADADDVAAVVLLVLWHFCGWAGTGTMAGFPLLLIVTVSSDDVTEVDVVADVEEAAAAAAAATAAVTVPDDLIVVVVIVFEDAEAVAALTGL